MILSNTDIAKAVEATFTDAGIEQSDEATQLVIHPATADHLKAEMIRQLQEAHEGKADKYLLLEGRVDRDFKMKDDHIEAKLVIERSPFNLQVMEIMSPNVEIISLQMTVEGAIAAEKKRAEKKLEKEGNDQGSLDLDGTPSADPGQAPSEPQDDPGEASEPRADDKPSYRQIAKGDLLTLVQDMEPYSAGRVFEVTGKKKGNLILQEQIADDNDIYQGDGNPFPVSEDVFMENFVRTQD